MLYFINCLKDISENGEISHEKHEKFLNELTEKASVISDLKDEKVAIFSEEYSIYLNGFNDTEIKKVYNKLPATSFTDDKSTFEKNVSSISDEVRSEQERFRLLELWNKLTETKDPYEWSDKYRTPIKATPHNSRLRLFHSLACIKSVIFHKFPSRRVNYARGNLFHLTNFLTAQLSEKNRAVVP